MRQSVSGFLLLGAPLLFGAGAIFAFRPVDIRIRGRFAGLLVMIWAASLFAAGMAVVAGEDDSAAILLVGGPIAYMLGRWQVGRVSFKANGSERGQVPRSIGRAKPSSRDFAVERDDVLGPVLARGKPGENLTFVYGEPGTTITITEWVETRIQVRGWWAAADRWRTFRKDWIHEWVDGRELLSRP